MLAEHVVPLAGCLFNLAASPEKAARQTDVRGPYFAVRRGEPIQFEMIHGVSNFGSA